MSEDFDVSKVNFTIKVVTPSGSEVEVNPISQLVINDTDIRKEIRILPAQYAFFGAVYVHYKKNRDVLKNKHEQLRNAYSRETRKLKRGITNKEVDEIVNSLEDVKMLSDKIIDADYYVDQLKLLVDGLDKKQKALSALDWINAREEKVNGDLGKHKIFEDTTSAIDVHKYEKTKQI